MKLPLLIGCAAIWFASCNNPEKPAEQQPVAADTATHKAAHISVNTPDEAIAQLKEGNQRYMDGKLINTDYKAMRDETKADQHPYAMILSCMDSRVPPEIIFDQGIGKIFIARVAGNIEDLNVLGSLEYGGVAKGVKVIVVLGHQKCGAIKGTIENVKLGNLTQLLEQIKPALKGDTTNMDAMMDATAQNNVRMTIADIMQKSPDLAALVKENKLKIVGAYYNLATGKVDFMD